MRCFFRISLLPPPPPPPCTLPSTAVPKTRTVKTTKISLVGSILLMLSYVSILVVIFTLVLGGALLNVNPFEIAAGLTQRTNSFPRLLFRTFLLPSIGGRFCPSGESRRRPPLGSARGLGQWEGSIGNPGGGELLFWPPPPTPRRRRWRRRGRETVH